MANLLFTNEDYENEYDYYPFLSGNRYNSNEKQTILGVKKKHNYFTTPLLKASV